MNERDRTHMAGSRPDGMFLFRFVFFGSVPFRFVSFPSWFVFLCFVFCVSFISLFIYVFVFVFFCLCCFEYVVMFCFGLVCSCACCYFLL